MINQTPQEDPRNGLPSASGIDRLWHCPGSRAAEKDLPDLKSEDVTEAGTRIHESFASGDDSELEISEREIKDRAVKLEEFAIEKWKEDFHVVKVVKSVRDCERYWIRDHKLNQIASALPDVVHIGECEDGSLSALVLNLKTGFKEQTPSEKNWQCRTEVLSVVEEHDNIKTARAGIVASRLYSKIDTTDYDQRDMVNIKRDIDFASWRSEQPDAPRNPGSHCRWCKARGLCRESATMALVVAQGVKFKNIQDSLDVAELIKYLTPAQLKYVYDRRSLATEIIEGSVQRLKGLPSEQLALIGLKLVDGAQLKPVTNIPLAYQRLEAVLGKDAMMGVISVARGKAAEVLCEQKQISLKAAKEEVDKILGDAITPKEGAKRLKSV